MKKLLFAVLAVCVLLALCSCQVTRCEPIDPLETKVYNFDLNYAEKMIAPSEKLVADLIAKPFVTRQDFNRFLSEIDQIYGEIDSRQSWVGAFVDNREFEDESVSEFHFNDRLFYPTIYHENVEIISATVTDVYYENPRNDMSLLTISVAYTGDDKNLEGWQRDYVYKKSDDNEWVYEHGMRGNAFGEELTHDYLKLK